MKTDRAQRARTLVQWLFLPCIAVMNRLSFGRKFVLIGLLVSIPLALLAWLQFSNATRAIEFNGRERDGIAYIQPARDLLLWMARHRILSDAVAAGVPSRRVQAERAASEVDRAMIVLTQADGRFGSWLRTTQALDEVRQRWARLRNERTEDGPLQDREHVVMIEQLVFLISHTAGNRSNLILDPDLDSYWLMDAFVIKLPHLAATVTDVCAAALLPGGESPIERTAALASGYRQSLATSSDLASISLRTAFDETASFGKSETIRDLDRPMQDVVGAVGMQADYVRSVLSAPAGSARDREPLIDLTLTALDRIDALSARVGPELDKLVAARQDRYRTQRRHGSLAAIAAAALLGYLLIGLWMSVRSSVDALSSEEFTAPSRDELGQIASAYTRARGEKTILQQQLVHADRLATIGKLAAGTAHELNEPLGAILGFSQLALKEPDLQEQTRSDLARIERAALHAREVIRKLMLFARQTVPHKSRVRLNPIVIEGLDLVQVRADEQGVQIERQLPPDLAEIIADPAHVRQVVINLTVNAIQASHAGGTVRVITRNGSGVVELTIDDEGVGMNEETLKNLFVPFYTTKDVGQGTGLGLSVVHGIVTSHGGSIDVESEPGRGTRVKLRLPQAHSAAPAAS
ncbi:MAG: hypothetical protein HY898_31660 [Deltaproteobacteria bacterium]|nr:hypothetical protein [Deltaproteobacteria bacterium]